MPDPLAALRLDAQPLPVRWGTWWVVNRWRARPALALIVLLPVPLVHPAVAVVLVLAALVVLEPLVLAWSATRGSSLAPACRMHTRGLRLGVPPFRVRVGDLVVVGLPGMRLLTKRVAALPGDRLAFRGGAVFRWDDGWVPLPLAADLTQLDVDHDVVAEVPEGAVFVLGEHVGSIDSRHFGAVPLACVVGRYVPLLQWGALPDWPLTPEEEADLAAIRAAETGGRQTVSTRFRERVERVLAVGGESPAHRVLLFRRALLEAGDVDRVDALLERAWRALPDDRALWTRLIAELRVDRDPEAALAAVQRQTRLLADPLLRSWEAVLLSRLGRYTEALAVLGRPDAPRVAAVEVAAHLGLGDVDAARRAVARADTDGAWALPCHGPYYRALVAVAAGELEDGARLLRDALAAGFDDDRLLDETPHLAALRASPLWATVRQADAGSEG